ncbi:glycosyltransferase family 4 protein [Marinobacterium litorale]|uniref:glycosyltransferase family 4 protein n=1 Tax=Marinobacterium litorale TaxID=404770 RepID=UPI000413ADFE|nr:glycosyltransferase family 4 protein [Marinobacterium litorale]
MKVMQVLPALDSGGVERGTLEVAEYLVNQGHESLVVSAGGRLVDELCAAGSRHIELDLGIKSPWTFRHVFAVRRLLRKERPDILHLRSRMPAWVCWLAWRGLPEQDRPHLVTTVHGLYSVSGYSAIMCRGERVIAVSQTVKAYIQQNYPQTADERIRLIYRGIDANDFPADYQPSEAWREAWYDQYPQLKGQQVLTLPGRLTRLKGHGDFIDLIASLRLSGQPVHGLIVGGEDPKRRAYAQELRARVKELGLEDSIHFTGARSDIREIYAVSDIVFSLSTKPESFGRTVAEALSMKVAVVGYAHGGVGEILAAVFPQGRVELGDSETLQKRVLEQLKTPSVPGEMPFLRETMLEQTLACYSECLK